MANMDAGLMELCVFPEQLALIVAMARAGGGATAQVKNAVKNPGM